MERSLPSPSLALDPFPKHGLHLSVLLSTMYVPTYHGEPASRTVRLDFRSHASPPTEINRSQFLLMSRRPVSLSLVIREYPRRRCRSWVYELTELLMCPPPVGPRPEAPPPFLDSRTMYSCSDPLLCHCNPLPLSATWSSYMCTPDQCVRNPIPRCATTPVHRSLQAEVMGSRAAWALGEWSTLEAFVQGEHMQARRHVIDEGQGVETCLVLEAVVATQKGRLDEVSCCGGVGTELNGLVSHWAG